MFKDGALVFATGFGTKDPDGGRLVLRFEQAPCFTADLEHWHCDTLRMAGRDPYVPPGLVTFPLSSKAAVTDMRFDQPNVLDVDFGELDFRRIGA